MTRPDRTPPPGRRRWPTVLAVALAVAVVVVVVWLLLTEALLGDDAGSGAAAVPGHADRPAAQQVVLAG